MVKKQVPQDEISFQTVRSSGPGGQHVNKTESCVQLKWDVFSSAILSEQEKIRVQNSQEFKNKINNDGCIVLESSDTRSQKTNKEKVVQKLHDLLKNALFVPKKRRATKPTRSSKEKRLKGKKERSNTKKLRGDPSYD